MFCTKDMVQWICAILAITAGSLIIGCQSLNTVTECFDDNDCAHGGICTNGVCKGGAEGTESEPIDKDTSSESDADTDGDSDADTDTNSDNDTDTDTNSDTDIDTDIDTDTDTDTGTDTDTDSDSVGDTDTSAAPECTQDEDCTLYGDCCACIPLGLGEEAPECAVMECDESACSFFSIHHDFLSVVCSAGRCVFDISCSSTQVNCEDPAPECGDGLVPAIDDMGECWAGECLLPEVCREITDCGQCPENMLCVENGAWLLCYHCVDIPPECADSLDCECMGENVCPGIGLLCGKTESGLGCYCPDC